MPCPYCSAPFANACRRDNCPLKGNVGQRGSDDVHSEAAVTAFDGVEAQLARLDLQEGDIVTVRTGAKLDADKARRWQEGLEELIRAEGWRNVGVLILDDCTEIAVDRADRPDTRQVQQSRDVPQPMQVC